jgi:hypothetical protein
MKLQVGIIHLDVLLKILNVNFCYLIFHAF